jgi:large subunit ribosomal protein L25
MRVWGTRRNEVEQKTLSATARQKTRKGETGRLRRQGKIPAVIYGHIKATPIAIDEREFTTKFHTISENTIINISVDGNMQDVLVKDYQENLMTRKILHIDFYAIEKGKVLKTRIPVRVFGSAKGVREGGILEVQLHEIDVECLPKDLPSEFAIDITTLEANHAIHVREIPLPEGVRFLNNPDQVVVSIAHAKAEVVTPEAAAAAEAAAATAEAATAAAAPAQAG